MTIVDTITLEPDIAQQMTQIASDTESDVDTLVDQALRTYLRQYQREKIRTEMAAFAEQKSTLLAQYAGQYIAMHQGNVIDHDFDLRVLHLRVFEKLGHKPVLLKKVTEEPERELVFRSPRFERE